MSSARRPSIATVPLAYCALGFAHSFVSHPRPLRRSLPRRPPHPLKHQRQLSPPVSPHWHHHRLLRCQRVCPQLVQQRRQQRRAKVQRIHQGAVFRVQSIAMGCLRQTARATAKPVVRAMARSTNRTVVLDLVLTAVWPHSRFNVQGTATHTAHCHRHSHQQHRPQSHRLRLPPPHQQSRPHRRQARHRH
jgi:hypothetical protein